MSAENQKCDPPLLESSHAGRCIRCDVALPRPQPLQTEQEHYAQAAQVITPVHAIKPGEEALAASSQDPQRCKSHTDPMGIL